eukprot:TRINITY_DN10982_c0_g1_i1.p1 TRINITY_DN10982_c0_g1~~TRINITY_DN10982_c0_g1_i1.p1  ORF type:complete len:135 (-),score=21.04 TRINITY_DN10982_c0_g1_i1:112-516(-)
MRMLPMCLFKQERSSKKLEMDYASNTTMEELLQRDEIFEKFHAFLIERMCNLHLEFYRDAIRYQQSDIHRAELACKIYRNYFQHYNLAFEYPSVAQQVVNSFENQQYDADVLDEALDETILFLETNFANFVAVN